MASLIPTLNIGGVTLSSSKTYKELFDLTQEVDNSDGFINIIQIGDAKGTNVVPSVEALCIQNTGSVGAEIQLKTMGWIDNSNTDDNNSVDLGEGATNYRYHTMLIPAGEYIYLPNARLVSYNEDASAANAPNGDLDNSVPAASMYVAIDTGTEIVTINDVSTSLTVVDEDWYKAGDLIRVVDEIMEVTDITGTTLTVIRGVYGSTAVSHTNEDVRFPFFNMYGKHDKFSVAQTDSNGRFWAKNFFGQARTSDDTADGIVPGSVALKFYSQGYQEIGFSDLTSGVNTGLTASTVYDFGIAVDGGSAQDIAVTVDSDNLNFGGTNGLIEKIQAQLDLEYYDSSSKLFEKKISVGIVNGDLRFTSGTYLSTSAIALSADAGGTGTDLWEAGRFPALADIEGAVASKLPDDVVYDKKTYASSPNAGAFMYDDGKGNLSGAGNGTINYETGEIKFTAVPNAEFVVSCSSKSAHSGGISHNAYAYNSILAVGARCVNKKSNTTIRVLAFH